MICMEVFESDQSTTTLCCGHVFHFGCIGTNTNRLDGVIQCPLCRCVEANVPREWQIDFEQTVDDWSQISRDAHANDFSRDYDAGLVGMPFVDLTSGSVTPAILPRHISTITPRISNQRRPVKDRFGSAKCKYCKRRKAKHHYSNTQQKAYLMTKKAPKCKSCLK